MIQHDIHLELKNGNRQWVTGVFHDDIMTARLVAQRQVPGSKVIGSHSYILKGGEWERFLSRGVTE